jgi:hypothetical protein
MGILPNFTAVDSNTYLPRLFTGEKFNIAAHDSVDYSSFLLVGVLAGKGLYSNTIPAFGTGPSGFRRYYWREFTDQVSGTFFTEAILPTLTHEDPRYYTLGKNGFFKRVSYAVSRSFITRNDRGTNEIQHLRDWRQCLGSRSVEPLLPRLRTRLRQNHQKLRHTDDYHCRRQCP